MVTLGSFVLCFGVPVVEAAQRPEDHTARSADLYQSFCPLDAAGGICKPDVLSTRFKAYRSLIVVKRVVLLCVMSIWVLLWMC